MLFLFVWFLLFKFPPAQRGKQSLTVKQIGKLFFFLSSSFSQPKLSVKLETVRRQCRAFILNQLRICFSFHCVIIFQTGPLVCVRRLPTWQEWKWAVARFESEQAEMKMCNFHPQRGKKSVTTSSLQQDVSRMTNSNQRHLQAICNIKSFFTPSGWWSDLLQYV